MLAAALLLLLTVAVLGMGTQVVILTQGRGHEAALLKSFLLIAANQLTQMLVILVLTVVMNNIFAAIIGVVIVQVTKFMGTANVILGVLTDQGNNVNLKPFGTAVDIVYWIVPRYLESDLVRDVYASSAATQADSGLRFINVSGPGDVAFWAAYIVLLFGLLYLLLQRREV